MSTKPGMSRFSRNYLFAAFGATLLAHLLLIPAGLPLRLQGLAVFLFVIVVPVCC